MNQITSSYRIAEMINSGQFQLIQNNDSIIVNSWIELLNLVPVWGLVLSTAAKATEKLVVQIIEQTIKDTCHNTINSFYHKVLEETVELVWVDILLEHEDYIKTRIQEIEEQKRDRKTQNKAFRWVTDRFDDI